MAVSFNDEETERLARRLAAVTGTSVDEAVAEVVRVRPAELDAEEAATQRRRVAMQAALAETREHLAHGPVLDPRSPEDGGRRSCAHEPARRRTGLRRLRPLRQGRRRPGVLNFGDCLACGVAAALGEPLLFKGDDFPRTDVAAARY